MNSSILFSFHALIIHGEGMGRKLGFPTANLQTEDLNLIETMPGVYAVKVHLGEKILKGMLNIGHRPSFKNFTPSIEVHLFDFSDSIYGQMVQVDMLQKIRDEITFENPQMLIEQLHKDKTQALSCVL